MSYSGKDVLYNANVKEIVNAIIGEINNNGGIAIVGTPALSIGSSSTAEVKNGEFTVIRDGVISTIASAETAFTATTHDIDDGNEAIFNVYLDSSNDITLLMGEEVETADPSVAVCPDTPSGGLKIGEVKVAADGGNFDASTTSLSDTDITDTYTDKTDVSVSFDDFEEKHWMYHQNLEELFEDMVDIVENDGVARLISDPNLAIGSESAAKVKHDDFSYILDGEITTVSSSEVAFTEATHDIAADGTDVQEAIYVLSIDPSDDSFTLTMGDIADEDDAVAPSTPSGELKLGEVLIQVDNGSTDFDATSDELSAVHLTDEYSNKTDLADAADFDISNYGLEDYLYNKNFYDLLDDIEENLNRVSNDKVLLSPELEIGTDAIKLKNSAFDVMRDGVISTISSTETAFTDTTDDVADGYGAVYNIYLDSSNTIKILKGTATEEGEDAECPDTPSGGMKIGELKVVADGDDFDATTTK